MKPNSRSPSNPRLTAIRILQKVIEENRPLDKAFDLFEATLSENSQQSFIKELCYGTLRWYFQLDAIAQSLLSLIEKRWLWMD